MKSVKKLAEEIVAREGGYVNDPADPGGPTKFGVTFGTLRRLRIDVDHDGDIDADDMKRLTREQAVEIFMTDYYQRPKIDLLPRSLQPTVFDMYVNAGGNAVIILQRLLCEFEEPVAVDGAIGPKTAAAANRAITKAGEFFVDAYGIARRNYYYHIADVRPASRKYARRRDGGKGGWITRAEEFISPKYHLTAAEHAKRVSAWG